MNAIQSYWTKPCFGNEENYENNRNKGGWHNTRYMLLSSCFSCLTLKRHYKNVILYTDSVGNELLINWLNLSYDNVSTKLDLIKDENKRLWVLGKFEAFKEQQEPFIHFDNDVFIWDKLRLKDVGNKYLIAQSRIEIPENYKQTLCDVFNKFDYLPEAIRKKGIPDKFLVANAGVIGGNDIDFFQIYYKEAKKFLLKNQSKINQINIGLFNTILDEYLFTCLANEKGAAVKYLFNSPIEDAFKIIMRFNLVPFVDKYVHLIGFAKKNEYACEQLELRFEYEFPKQYHEIDRKLEERFPNQKIGLMNDDVRLKRLMLLLKKLYNITLKKLLNEKIKMVELFHVRKEGNEEDIYYLEKFDSYKNLTNSYRLNGSDELLYFFDTPISINEMIDSIIEDNQSLNNEEIEHQKYKLLDFVTEKIIIEGILEFSESI